MRECDVKSNLVASVTEEDQIFARYSVGNQESEYHELKFSFKNLIDLAPELPVTKQSFLSVAARIYDPFDVISPVVIPIKILVLVGARERSTGMKSWMMIMHLFGRNGYLN